MTKAQFFAFGIIIFCSIVFFSLTNRVVLHGSNQRFQKIYNNYFTESNIVINNAILNKLNITQQMTDFTQNFKSYVKSKNLYFNAVYIVQYNDSILLGNFLNKDITISIGGLDFTMQPEATREIPKEDSITIIYDEISYNYNFTTDFNKLKALILVEE